MHLALAIRIPLFNPIVINRALFHATVTPAASMSPPSSPRAAQTEGVYLIPRGRVVLLSSLFRH